MLQRLGASLPGAAQRARARRRRCAFFVETAQAVAALSAARDLRQALRHRDQRRLPGRRLRAGAGLPLPRRRPTMDKPASACPRSRSGSSPAPAARSASSRLMQTGDALQMLFKGEQIRPAAAKTMGLVHEVAPAGRDRRAAKAWITGGGKASAPWDDEGFRLPSGQVFSPQGMMVWPAANAIYRRETHDNYPAAKAILHVGATRACSCRWTWRCGREPLVRQVLRSPEAGAMIRTLFVSMQELNKGARRPDGRAAGEAEEGRRPRRRLHGRGHRLCHGARRDRGRADRPRPGERPTRARRYSRQAHHRRRS